MTVLTRSMLLSEVIALIGELANDWDYDGVIDENTGVFGDLGFESLDLVVLGASLQERYGRLPFSEFLAELGRQKAEDCTIDMLVQFMIEHIGSDGAAGR